MELTAGGKTLVEVKIQRGIFLRDNFRNSKDATQLPTLKVHWGQQIYKIARKDHLIYMDGMKLFAKNEKEKTDTNIKNIQPGYRNGIWHRKMCHTRKQE